MASGEEEGKGNYVILSKKIRKSSSRMKDSKLVVKLALTMISPIDQGRTKKVSLTNINASLKNMYEISTSPFHIASNFNSIFV